VNTRLLSSTVWRLAVGHGTIDTIAIAGLWPVAAPPGAEKRVVLDEQD